MDEEIERMMISVRADTQGFARDVAEMRGQIDGPLEAGAQRAGRAIESALLRAVKTGKLGFEDLRVMALGVLGEIAASALHQGLGALTGGGASGGLFGAILSLFGGSPGRATGGPVAPGRPYWVGERGPELFVPTSAGAVTAVPPIAAPREVRVTITVNAAAGEAPRALAQSSRQVARAVRAALATAE